MKILFLCAGNRFRSQIAETLFNHYAKEKGLKHTAESAALIYQREKVHHHTIRAMKEINFDISNNKPKKINDELLKNTDIFILLNKNLEKHFLCPAGKKCIIWDIPDVKAEHNEEEKYIEFVKVRNLIEQKIKDFLERL